MGTNIGLNGGGGKSKSAHRGLRIYTGPSPRPPLPEPCLPNPPSFLSSLPLLASLPHPYSPCGNTMAFNSNNNDAAANNAVETSQRVSPPPALHPTTTACLTGTGRDSIRQLVRRREPRRHRDRVAARSRREAATGTRTPAYRGGEARLPVCPPAVRRGSGSADRATAMQGMGRPRQGPAVDEAARQEELVVMTAAAVGAAAAACACCCYSGRGCGVAFEAWRGLA